MSVMGAMLQALDRGLVVFKTDQGLVVAGHPINSATSEYMIANLIAVEMVWDQDDLADARTLAAGEPTDPDWPVRPEADI